MVRSLVLADSPLYSVFARDPEARTLLAEWSTALSGVQNALEAGTEDVAIRKFLDSVFAASGFVQPQESRAGDRDRDGRPGSELRSFERDGGGRW